MKIIGLTGGIASGKSLVLNTLEKFDVIVINTDKVAHLIMEPDQPAWQDIVAFFGTEVLQKDRRINRTLLGQIVFDNQDHLEKLNQFTHPRVGEYIDQKIRDVSAEKPEAILILEVPLLFEVGMDRMCDQIWVVWVDKETQIDRLMNRENISRADAIKRINSQMDLDQKAELADFVIDNSNSIAETVALVEKKFREEFLG